MNVPVRVPSDLGVGLDVGRVQDERLRREASQLVRRSAR